MSVAPAPAHLVTGGAGFIGACLVAALTADGSPVTVVDRMPWSRAHRLHGIPSDLLTYHAADIRDASALRGIVAGHRYVYHLSSNTENRPDRAESMADFSVTAGGTVALLEALRGEKVEAVVLTSSQLVYGGATGRIDEGGTPPCPLTPFAAGKVAAEAFLSCYAHELGFRSVAARLSNIIGPRMGRGIVHDLVRNLDRDSSHIRVLGDGRQTRSYLHVDDCVRGLRAAMERCSEPFEAIHVCNRDTTGAAEVARIVAQEYPGGSPEIRFTGGEQGWAGDVPTLRVLPERLVSWGWEPHLDSDRAVRVTARAMFREEA